MGPPWIVVNQLQQMLTQMQCGFHGPVDRMHSWQVLSLESRHFLPTSHGTNTGQDGDKQAQASPSFPRSNENSAILDPKKPCIAKQSSRLQLLFPNILIFSDRLPASHLLQLHPQIKHNLNSAPKRMRRSVPICE
ncbi:hypothetical protein HBH56_017550 [Parastagonospora nodorum]|uniref:Uncharacterized protein n=1 Tax=Phaeosphaeria nodorum (strain SN15 / ATCC MYA-4574 / FGSC 10173) TaxID=321614 RepID=A0A7U2F1Y4_PHANO|nr:hypothetical protein HBH56_017550 [Parastagonospora nodorum]QRC95195.1 hypothetical protein JI435_431920 [Parastagonospora nodorum SN15]KAH3937415.1 hypothetical protein HBH54_016930 [Parastagonospora nodorum]KAH4059406.1 hypothetical protein HBH49_017740 [Parastagonospora nodorum]KAH4137282.1 hypothetical protein HBH45_123860 [Parastagonospora nodorum]